MTLPKCYNKPYGVNPYVFIGFFVSLFFPLWAVEGDIAGELAASGEELVKSASSLKSILLGPVRGIAGVIGLVTGVVTAFIQRALQPLFVYAGIGVAVLILPKVFDGLLSATIPF